MIQITKEPNADSRTAQKNVGPDELLRATKSHIKDIDKGLNFFANMLKEAGKKHDHLKIEKIDEFYDALTGGKIKSSDWYEEHITKERHHLIAKVPDDVNLIDVLEHLVDCCISGLSRSGEIYDVDIDPRILKKAHENTIELLKKNIKVSEAPKSDKIEDTPLN